MSIIVGNQCICDLAKALGLDGRPIVRIRIDAEIRKAVIVEITEHMQVEGHDKMCEAIKHYRLEAVEPDKAVRFREFT